MRSIILRTAADILHPVLLLFSVYLLVQGHDEPGGGFSAGLVAAAAYVFYAVAHEVRTSRLLLRASPLSVLASGLAIALLVSWAPTVWGAPLLDAVWWEGAIPIWGDMKVGSPIVFDVGVYLTVVGATLTVFFAAMEA